VIFKANKDELLGRNHCEKVHVETVKGVTLDANKALFELLHSPNELSKESVTKALEEKVTPKLNSLSKDLGKKDFITGDLTIADFKIAELVYRVRLFNPSVISGFQNLSDLEARIKAFPGVADYLKKDKKGRKVFGPQAMTKLEAYRATQLYPPVTCTIF